LSFPNKLIAVFLCALFLLSCSLQARLPTVSDEPVERLVENDAAQIVAVTDDKNNFSEYQFFLADFPRKDILGLSIGDRRIYISHKLGQVALQNPRQRWLLRQTLAHEIAHELAGHAKQTGMTSFNRSASSRAVTGADLGLPGHIEFHSYSVENELEADLEGMRYWSKLHWDCRIWVRILEGFRQQNYIGDALHPTDERLKQAVTACLPESDDERIAIETDLLRKGRAKPEGVTEKVN
jgi:predicted Zn-dependent protease